jgi:dolichyl-phosphate beta-glucosyltransferase
LSLVIGGGLAVTVLAYPIWFGLAGPQAVSGLLFPFAPIAGALLWQFFSTAGARLPSLTVVRVTGYLGHNGPQANFVGWGEGAVLAVSVVAARRRPLAWLWIFLALAGAALSLGSLFLGPPAALRHIWLPWRVLAHLPVLDEIVPDQLSWFVTLCVAFLIALGLDAVRARCASAFAWNRRTLRGVGSLLAVGVGLVALVPVFMTYDVPLRVTASTPPRWMAHVAPTLPNRSVVLTVPFAVSGSADPMLWQAVDGMHFRLAGAALKTPDAHGHPVAQGPKDSARGILSALSLGLREPAGTAAQLATVRRALRTWQVDRVVIDGPSGDPVYASGFLTAVLGTPPDVIQGAWVWKVASRVHMAPMITDASLGACRSASRGSSARHRPLAMAHCVRAALSAHHK